MVISRNKNYVHNAFSNASERIVLTQLQISTTQLLEHVHMTCEAGIPQPAHYICAHVVLSYL